MRDSLTAANYADFRQRYEKTYGFFPQKDGNKRLVFMKKNNDEQVVFTDSSGMDYHANAGAGVEFEFLPLQRGLFNILDDVVFISRKADRQYKRGIADTNTTIMRMSTLRGEVISFKLLEQVFAFTYPVKERLALFKEKGTPVALSKNFALVGNEVYFNDIYVGNVKATTLSVLPIVLQELGDVVRRNELPLTVVENT